MPRLGAWGGERWTRVRGSGWRQLVPSHCLCLHNMTARRHHPPELLRGWGRAAVGQLVGGAGPQVQCWKVSTHTPRAWDAGLRDCPSLHKDRCAL